MKHVHNEWDHSQGSDQLQGRIQYELGGLAADPTPAGAGLMGRRDNIS